jgi:hypothetical protein
MTINERVVCTFLHHEGDFPGLITDVTGHCYLNDVPVVRVQLDRQEAPVDGVLAFGKEPPDVIRGSRWQFCVPEVKE